MAAYIIRNIDTALWNRVKSRAEEEQTSLRQVLLTLLRAYADGLPIVPMSAFIRDERTEP